MNYTVIETIFKLSFLALLLIIAIYAFIYNDEL